ncbi:MAG TPA: GTPase HflX [Acidobacteriaceae bacterium]|nr:GTPase HflX [Acidobacteriaceae bacterium]
MASDLQAGTSGRGRGRGARERAVLVAVDFTSSRGALSSAARQARAAAALDSTTRGEAQAAAPQPAPSRDLEFDESLAEFQELARSAGAEIAAVLVQHRPRPDPATLVGGGKLDEIDATARATEADLVLFDHDLSPSQLRNLEGRLPCRVIDRTQLILDIFARHARTREGQLQVELAQLEYQLPRLAGRGKAMSQLGGGIGTRGPGETQLETDRRRINTRIDRIKQQLEAVRRIRRQQRGRREAVPVPTVALVGYTNAGKSTLFNKLTGAEVLASERMFATLDPKLRQLSLPSRRKVLLSDTVGFIRKLPHSLVTSFRATLEEVERAELLVHVRDAASPLIEEQRSEVEAVLDELGVGQKPVLHVFNKIDLLGAPGEQGPFPPDAIPVSALTGEGTDVLLRAIDDALTADPLMEARFCMPQSEGRVLAALERGATLSEQSYDGDHVCVTALGPSSLLGRYRRYQVQPEATASNNTGRLSGERR